MKAASKFSFISHKRTKPFSTFTFHTENTYEIPLAIINSDILQFQSVLTFAAKLIEQEKTLSTEYVRDTMFAEYVKTLEDKHVQEIEKIKRSESEEISSKLSPLISLISEKEKEYSESINRLHSDYTQQVKLINKEKAKLEEDATATKQDIESNLQKEIKSLRKQITEREAEIYNLSKSDSIIREQCQAESDRLIKVIEEKNRNVLEAMRESYLTTIKLKEESLEQREARLLLKEQELQKQIHRNASSSFRGQDGEKLFEHIVEQNMGWKLLDTSKIDHSCDYSSQIHGLDVFFELKNYTHPVESKEVTKFLRDMKEHPEVSVGIFISLNTRITGKNQEIPFSIEWINESQCAVYIQPFNDLDIKATLALIDQLIKLVSTYKKLSCSGTLSEDVILQNRIDKARVYIDQYILESSTIMKRLVNDKKRHLELVETTYSYTIGSLKSQAAAISTALSILTGEHIEDTIIDPILIPESEAVKPKKKSK
jgi:hypothetical protein